MLTFFQVFVLPVDLIAEFVGIDIPSSVATSGPPVIVIPSRRKSPHDNFLSAPSLVQFLKVRLAVIRSPFFGSQPFKNFMSSLKTLMESVSLAPDATSSYSICSVRPSSDFFALFPLKSISGITRLASAITPPPIRLHLPPVFHRLCLNQISISVCRRVHRRGYRGG